MWFASAQPPFGTLMPQSGRRPQHQNLPILLFLVGSDATPIATRMADILASGVLTGRAIAALSGRLDVNLLRYGEGIVYLYAQIPDRALDLGVAKEKLNGTEISRPAIYQCCLGPPRRVRAV